MSIFKKIIIGYSRLFIETSKNIINPIKISLFLIGILGLSIGIVYPLWFLASENPELYSKAVTIAIYTILVLFFIYRSYATIKQDGFKTVMKFKVFPVLKKIIIFIGFIVIILLSIFIYTYNVAFGATSTILFLFIIGMFKFVYKK